MPASSLIHVAKCPWCGRTPKYPPIKAVVTYYEFNSIDHVLERKLQRRSFAFCDREHVRLFRISWSGDVPGHNKLASFTPFEDAEYSQERYRNSIRLATTEQKDWLLRMQATVDQLHGQWLGHDGYEVVHTRFDKGLFEETNRKIRAACAKLNLDLVEAFDPDGWDGECYGPLVTLSDALRAIRKHFGLPQL
jgi:hypothetical protein